MPTRTSRRLVFALLGLAATATLPSCAREEAPPVPVSSPSAAPSSSAQMDVNNELPFGAVDWPHDGATVPPSSGLLVAGWAMDDSAIKEIRVFFDNRFKMSAPVAVERPDLMSAHAKYSHGTNIHGFRIQIVMPAGSGSHSILVQAVDDKGATRDLGALKIQVK